MTLALPARAKLNLDLIVVRRADDGFHELQTTFQEIELHDLLLIQRSPQTDLTIEGIDVARKGNSVLAAHEAIEQATGRKLNANFHLYTRIPPGSGTYLSLAVFGRAADCKSAIQQIKNLRYVTVLLPGCT